MSPTWRKVCKCKDALAATGQVKVMLEKGHKTFKLVGVLDPDLVCLGCGKPWRKVVTEAEVAS